MVDMQDYIKSTKQDFDPYDCILEHTLQSGTGPGPSEKADHKPKFNV